MRHAATGHGQAIAANQPRTLHFSARSLAHGTHRSGQAPKLSRVALSDTIAPMRVRVLSYNIHKGIGVDRRFDPQRIIEILRHHSAHIVLLQEVDRHAERSNRLDLASLIARALEYPYRSVGM